MRYFNCLRDAVIDRIGVTYKAGEPRPAGAWTLIGTVGFDDIPTRASGSWT